jgi:hypothetical protein
MVFGSASMFQIALIHGHARRRPRRSDRAGGGLDRRIAVLPLPDEPVTVDAGRRSRRPARAPCREAAQRRHVVRVAATLLVQHRRDVLRLPVVESPCM